jgi:hypothetical protein
MSWMAINNGTEIWARFDQGYSGAAPPADVEVTVRSRVFAPHVRGLGHVVVRGFVLEHAANQYDDGFWVARRQQNNPSPAAFAQAGLLGTRAGHNWLIEHNVIRHAKSTGIDIGDEGGPDTEGFQPLPPFLGNHTLRWNEVVGNGAKGITGSFGSVGPFPFDGLSSAQGQPCVGCEVHRNRGGTVAFNIIANNNFLGCHAAENGAFKVHGFSGLVMGNLVVDNPNSAGMWFDDLWWDLHVTRNVVIATAEGSWAGVMLEVSTGPALIDNNIIITSGGSGGIYESDSNNVTVVQNLVVNTAPNNSSFSALNLGGCGGRSYNVGEYEPGTCEYAGRGWACDYQVSWLSYGCGLAPTNATTNKNYFVEGNIFAGPLAATITACGTNSTARQGHVCCNNTVIHNALNSTQPAAAPSGNVASAAAVTLIGELKRGNNWNFSSHLGLRLAVDTGPSVAGGTVATGAGADQDFYGRPRRAAARSDGRVAEAGPFEGMAGQVSSLSLWPPPEVLSLLSSTASLKSDDQDSTSCHGYLVIQLLVISGRLSAVRKLGVNGSHYPSCGPAGLDLVAGAKVHWSLAQPNKGGSSQAAMKTEDETPHGPISFSYNRSHWCTLGAAASPPPRAGYWAPCTAANFTAVGDNHTTASALVGETTYTDNDGLRVQVSWKQYTNVSLGVAGSREWSVELRYSSGSGCARGSSLPVCGPDDFFAAPGTPPPPPAPCPAPQNITVNAGINGQDLRGCTNAKPLNTSIDPTGCSLTRPGWAANATLGFEECAAACCKNLRCVGMMYQQVSQWDGFGHCRAGAPCCWLKAAAGPWDPRPPAEGAKTAVMRPGCLWPGCGTGQPPAAGPVLVDITLPCPAPTSVVTLHHQLGSEARPSDFSAVDDVLAPGTNLTLGVTGGRSSEGALPVWNLEVEGSGGVVVALGWSGNWQARVERSDDGRSVRLTVAPGTLCASLRPGESVYLGRALQVPYPGVDYRLGYVLLRRLMNAYIVPRLADGKLPHFLATESYDRWPESDPQWGTDGVRNETNAHWVQDLAASGGLDSYWMDANWFHSPGGLVVGNWRLPLSEVENTLAFPSGIRALFDHARSHVVAATGKPMKVIMWTEPERVSPGTFIFSTYPEYVFHRGLGPSDTTVIDLGNPDALRYIQQFVEAAVEKYQLDVWRVDFNTVRQILCCCLL